MDPITQAALGATVGHAVFHRRLGMRAAAVGAVVGMFPDIDTFYGTLEGPFGRLVSHRGITHSLFFGPVVGTLGGWAWWRWLRRRGGAVSPAAPGPGVWVGLFVLALVSHPLLDWFTTFGTQLLAPFSRTRFALDGVAVVDPVYTVLLGLGLLGGRRLAGRPSAGWPTAIALVLSTAYLMLGMRINALAELEARQQLAATGQSGFEVSAYPTMLQLPHRRLVARFDDEVWVGFVSMWRPCTIEWGRAPLYKSANVETLRATREGRIYDWFTGGRLISKETTVGDERVVEMIDLRYGYALDPTQGLWGVRARFDPDGALIGRPERFNSRPEVSGETVGQLLADAFPAACVPAMTAH